MIYQQQTAVADAPATMVEAIAALGSSSSSYSCAAAVAMTTAGADAVVQDAVASSGFS